MATLDLIMEKRLSQDALEIVRGRLLNRYYYSNADKLGRREFIDYCPSDERGQAFFCVPFTLPGGPDAR